MLDASMVAKWVIFGEPWDKEARLVEEKVANGELKLIHQIFYSIKYPL